MMRGQIEEGVYKTNVRARHQRGGLVRSLYFSSLIIALAVLLVLAASIVNGASGLVYYNYAIDPDDISPDKLYTELNSDELAQVIVNAAPRRVLVTVRDALSGVANDVFTRTPLAEAINGDVPEEFAALTITELTPEQQGQILALNLSPDQMREIVDRDILKPEILQSWRLFESLLERDRIQTFVEDTYPPEEYPNGELSWRTWLTLDFVMGMLKSIPGETGILPALLGTLWLALVTITFALPVGVGAAIYLQEYAQNGWFSRLVEVNIRNLAGVPSIIYGMLGLTIFVGAGFPLSFNFDRTVIAGGLTLGLLILPVIIVSAREALRAVPNTIREASYGLGATKWQTVSRQVLPAALPGIMTGLILGVSRAIGETAPLVVVGAAAYINTLPDGPGSRFTALPMLIYNWTSQPNEQYRNIASAAIIVLLIVLLSLNATAIIIRNRASNKRML